MPNPKKFKSPDEKLLADRLKGEADTMRPAFSDALHAQIMQRVTAASQQHTSYSSSENATFARPEKRGPVSRRPMARAWSTLTAALVVAWGLWFGLASRSPIAEQGFVSLPPQTVPNTDPLADPSGPNESPIPAATAEQIGDTVMLDQAEILDQTAHLVESVLTNQQWAYLEHDAQVLANLLFDQLPLEARQAGDL